MRDDMMGSYPNGIGAQDGALPVWPTATAALGFGFRMIRFALLAGALAATAVGLMMVLGAMPTPSPEEQPDQSTMMAMGAVGDLVLLVVSFLMTAVFTVFFHRRVMLGPLVATRLRVSAREARFLVATVLYSIVAFFPGVVLMIAMTGGGMMVGGPGVMLLALAVAGFILFLFVRFALAFPAIAVDAPGSLLDQFKNSFVATRGRAWNLFGVYVTAYLLFLMAAMAGALVLAMVVAGAVASGASAVVVVWISLLIQVTLQFVALATFASIASRAFMAWSGWEPPVAAPSDDDAPLAPEA